MGFAISLSFRRDLFAFITLSETAMPILTTISSMYAKIAWNKKKLGPRSVESHTRNQRRKHVAILQRLTTKRM